MTNPKFKEPEVDSDFEDDEDDRYDAQGRPCPGGMYDAGGHLVDSEKFYDYLDYLRDRQREQG